MNRINTLIVILCGGLLVAGVLLIWFASRTGIQPSAGPVPEKTDRFTGSERCRACHEKFYRLWATSHHGLAMQPYTPALARARLSIQETAIAVGDFRYRADVAGDAGWVLEAGPGGSRRYRIDHVLGGKNVFYFLTPLDRGRLQVLPVAYYVREKKWIDTTASMVRHVADRPVSWRDPLLTFNTACYGCHVSQIDTHYDLETDTYHTVWREPGINCETCHGPGSDHVRVCREAPEGETPADLKILGYKDLDIEQTNATCAPCHARARPLTPSFRPGDHFFDHFDLVAFEHPDFYPDGRDLGENYTFALWLSSPCVKAGNLSCIHCHTSSGRYRFKEENSDGACLPCHRARVQNAAAHHRHPAGEPGSRCVDCHMPRTFFARMARSDHSMRPPTPAATLAFGSPNACNLCHTDKDAGWADKWVRAWHTGDYQKPVLHRAGLIAAARKRDWSRLEEMFAFVTDPGRDPVFVVSLVRLLASCPDESKWRTFEQALENPSPLVRGAAAEGLGAGLTPAICDALLAATEDTFRLVRIRAAAALTALPRERLSPRDRRRLERASRELLDSFRCRPDQWTSHYNLGNYTASHK